MRGRRETRGKRTTARQNEGQGGVAVASLCSTAGEQMSPLGS